MRRGSAVLRPLVFSSPFASSRVVGPLSNVRLAMRFSTSRKSLHLPEPNANEVELVAEKEDLLITHPRAVEEFVKQGMLTNPEVIRACKGIDPLMFYSFKESAWLRCVGASEEEIEDSALGLLPYLVSMQMLSPRLMPGATVLDIGCGTGFVTTTLAEIIGKGSVFGLDRDPDKLQKARDIQRQGLKSRLKHMVCFVQGDGYDGLKEQSPYDAIHVGGAVDAISDEWVKQLRPGGLMTVPLIVPGSSEQTVTLVEKQFDGTLVKNSLGPAKYGYLR